MPIQKKDLKKSKNKKKKVDAESSGVVAHKVQSNYTAYLERVNKREETVLPSIKPELRNISNLSRPRNKHNHSLL